MVELVKKYRNPFKGYASTTLKTEIKGILFTDSCLLELQAEYFSSGLHIITSLPSAECMCYIFFKTNYLKNTLKTFTKTSNDKIVPVSQYNIMCHNS